MPKSKPSGSCLSSSLPADGDNHQQDRNAAVNVLKGINAFEVQDAIARAKRSKLDRGGRQWRIGAHVGMMCRQLLFWEQKGELADFWIHKTAREWLTADASFTPRMLRTAEKVAVEEGLMEIEVGWRPGDRQRTKFYRLNLWEVVRVVVVSELENIEDLLKHEGRKNRRDTLNRRRREFERARDDLNLLYERDSSPSEAQGGVMAICRDRDNNLYPLQENTTEITSVDIDISTPVRDPVGGDTEAGRIMNNIYNHLKETGFRLDSKEYGFNLRSVRRMLDKDNPTKQEIDELPEACRAYFEINSKLDVAKALRYARQQAARAHHEAGWSKGRKGKRLFGRGRGGTFRFDDDDPKKMLFGQRGEEHFDDEETLKRASSPGPGLSVRRQELHVYSDADDNETPTTEALQEEPEPEPKPVEPPPPAPPSLSEEQITLLSTLMRGRDRESALSRFAEHHLEGRTDQQGEPFTLERVAEKARELIAPGLPIESFLPTIRRILAPMRAFRELRQEREEERLRLREAEEADAGEAT